jgi:hypothetical protein
MPGSNTFPGWRLAYLWHRRTDSTIRMLDFFRPFHDRRAMQELPKNAFGASTSSTRSQDDLLSDPVSMVRRAFPSHKAQASVGFAAL